MGGDEAPFLREKHVEYLSGLEKQDKNSYEYCITEHIRMQGIFWCLGAADILSVRDKIIPDKPKLIAWVLSCYHDHCGGFSGNVGHDANVIDTQSAVYVLALCDSLNSVDADKVAEYIAARQNEDGSFSLDEWGQVDARVSYSALACLKLLNRMDKVDVDKAVEYVLSCRNFDGGFGCVPGAESHAGYIFTCVGALHISGQAGRLSKSEWDELAWFLAERQCDSGGLNGRPEKQADVCYSWWVLATLFMLGREDWIDKEKLVQFIYKCQDPETGRLKGRCDVNSNSIGGNKVALATDLTTLVMSITLSLVWLVWP